MTTLETLWNQKIDIGLNFRKQQEQEQQEQHDIDY